MLTELNKYWQDVMIPCWTTETVRAGYSTSHRLQEGKVGRLTAVLLLTPPLYAYICVSQVCSKVPR